MTIQDLDLQIPAMIHSETISVTLRRNTATWPLCAVKIDAVKKCGIEISES